MRLSRKHRGLWHIGFRRHGRKRRGHRTKPGWHNSLHANIVFLQLNNDNCHAQTRLVGVDLPWDTLILAFPHSCPQVHFRYVQCIAKRTGTQRALQAQALLYQDTIPQKIA